MADLLPKDIRELFLERQNFVSCKIYDNINCCYKKICKKDRWKENGHCPFLVSKQKHALCDNAYLLWNRFLDGEEEIKSSIDIKKVCKTNNYGKPYHHVKVNSKMGMPLQSAIQTGKECTNFAKQQKEAIQIMTDMHTIQVKKIRCKQDGHMVIGLGGNSVTEVSMTLHFINGVPYIPGQAIKGCLRSYVIQEIFDGNEKKAFSDPKFIAVFGQDLSDQTKEACAGNLIFFDAYPEDEPVIVQDIMTNHHQGYYEGSELNDSEQPNPIKFICMKDTAFEFIFGVRKRLYSPSLKNHESNIEKPIIFTPEELLNQTENWFLSMLDVCGFGAKSSVGYGYFSVAEETKLNLSGLMKKYSRSGRKHK